MPWRPPRLNNTAAPSYAWSGGSTRKWRKARAAQLERSPLCHDCRLEGRLEAAVDVHHIVEVSKGGNRWDPANMLSLCRYHHQQRHGAKPKIRFDPRTGLPLPNQDHPWSDKE
jgi:5-methylcytosine-specific restriction endonuclease McrA